MPFEVTDNQTGRVITFEKQPTDADIQEAFGVTRNAPAQQSNPPSPNNVPQWGQDNPNLYGAYGALKGVGEAVKNIPGSALNYGANMMKGITSLAGGLGSLIASPIETSEKIASALPKTPEAIREYVKQRYGDLDTVSNTAMKDPVGMLGDISLLYGGIGLPAKAAGLSKVGNALTKAGQAMEPLNAATQGIRKGIALLPESFETNLYARPAKFSTVLKDAEREKRINTALNEGIPLTRKGVEKSKSLVDDINKEVQAKIDALSSGGATVDAAKAVNNAADNQLDKIIGKVAFPEKPVQQVVDTAKEFEAHSPAQLTLRQAQDFKQSINKDLNDFYSAIKASPDKTAHINSLWSQKTKAAIADELRGQISEVFPEVSTLNAREGALIELNKSLERAVNRISNHDILSLKGIIGMVGSPKIFFTNYILNNPTVQSKLAIAIRKARTSPMQSSNWAYGRIGSSILGSDKSGEE